MDATSLVANVATGNVGGALVDAVGLVADVAAVAIPGAPGGAGTAIKAARGVDKAVDAVKAVDKVGNTVKTADKASDISKVSNHAKDISSSSNAAKNSKFGSYTIEFESGMKYHGKGSTDRMNTSARNQSRQHNDKVVSKEWSPATDNAQAFMDEALRIRADGGIKGNNYNMINSPGEKLLKMLGK